MTEKTVEHNKYYWNKYAQESDFYSAGAPSELGSGHLPYRSIIGWYRNKTELNHVKQYFDFKGKTLLDLGCGSGRLSIEFAKVCKRVVGVDFSESSIELAKQEAVKQNLTNVEFFVSNLQDFKINEKFDFIYLGGVFMCIEDKDILEIVKNITNLIHKDSIVINRDTISLLSESIYPDTPDYRRYRTIDECIALFSNYFEIFYKSETYPPTYPLTIFNMFPEKIRHTKLFLWKLRFGLWIQATFLDSFLLKRKKIYAKTAKAWKKRQFYFFFTCKK